MEEVMKKLIITLSSLALAMLLASLSSAGPGKPDFSPRVYADGVAWGTKVTTELPPPRGNNLHSYDAFYVIVNGPMDQLPVGEAAPRNPLYNGGRWLTYTVEWNAEGMAAHDPLPVLRSYDDIATHYDLEHLDITMGSPPGGPPPYFQCPLLPVKIWP